MEQIRAYWPAINGVLFQIVWFALVIQRGTAAVVLAGLAVVAHLIVVAERRKAARLIILATIFGVVVDTALYWQGYVTFPDYSGERLPMWLIMLWINLGTLFTGAIHWLMPRIWLAAVFGAVGGPLSYYAGTKLGAVQLAEGSLLLLAVVWFLLMIVFAVMAGRFTDHDQTASEPVSH